MSIHSSVLHALSSAALLFAALCPSVFAGEATPAPATTPAAEEKVGWPGKLNLLAGPPGGQWMALGQAMEKILDDNGIPTRNAVGGGVGNMEAIGLDKADIGFSLYSFLGVAEAGEKELPKINLENVRLLANLYPQVLYVIIRKDVANQYGIKHLGDLLKVKAPLRFATLAKGTGSEFIFNMLLKNGYRTHYDKLTEQGWNISFTSYANITKQFVNHELDICAYQAGPGTYLIPTLEEKKLDAILLPVEEEILNLMTHQFMTTTYVIKKGTYQSVTEAVPTLGDYSCLIVNAKLPEDLVHNVNKALWENRSELIKVTSDIRAMSPKIAVAGQSKVHPGSLRFWNAPAMQALKGDE